MCSQPSLLLTHALLSPLIHRSVLFFSLPPLFPSSSHPSTTHSPSSLRCTVCTELNPSPGPHRIPLPATPKKSISSATPYAQHAQQPSAERGPATNKSSAGTRESRQPSLPTPHRPATWASRRSVATQPPSLSLPLSHCSLPVSHQTVFLFRTTYPPSIRRSGTSLTATTRPTDPCPRQRRRQSLSSDPNLILTLIPPKPTDRSPLF